MIAGIGGDQWSAPTPCTEWSVRQVLNHLVGGSLFFVDLLEGQPLPPLGDVRARLAQDYLGDDPLAAFDTATTRLLGAFDAPGRLEQPLPLPIGTAPGAVALRLRLTEVLVHGWDLARATGQRLQVADDLVDEALAFVGTVELPRHAFAEPRPAPPDASAVDRLAARLGRSLD